MSSHATVSTEPEKHACGLREQRVAADLNMRRVLRAHGDEWLSGRRRRTSLCTERRSGALA